MLIIISHIGHWTLTFCLLPLLRATAAQKASDVRVVTVASVCSRTYKPRCDWKHSTKKKIKKLLTILVISSVGLIGRAEGYKPSHQHRGLVRSLRPTRVGELIYG